MEKTSIYIHILNNIPFPESEKNKKLTMDQLKKKNLLERSIHLIFKSVILEKNIEIEDIFSKQEQIIVDHLINTIPKCKTEKDLNLIFEIVNDFITIFEKRYKNKLF